MDATQNDSDGELEQLTRGTFPVVMSPDTVPALIPCYISVSGAIAYVSISHVIAVACHKNILRDAPAFAHAVMRIHPGLRQVSCAFFCSV